MIIIGERINSSRKTIAQAIEKRDSAFIQKEAIDQARAGADYIDVNAGSFAEQEADCLAWLVEKVQQAVDLPLCLDSPDPQVIKKVIPRTLRPALINSVTLEADRLDILLPLVLEHDAAVIALCQSSETLAHTATQKLELAAQLIEKVIHAGISLDKLYIDPLVYPLSSDPQSGVATLAAIEQIMSLYPGVHTVCGLTNISYGLPNRSLVNRSFLIACISRGLDAAIIDPTDNRTYGALKAATMIMGLDDYCMEFVTAYREGRLD